MSRRTQDTVTLTDLTAHSSQPERGSDRNFGIVFAAAFGVIAVWPFFHGGDLRTWAAIIAVAFLVVAFALPVALGPLNKLWMAFGLMLGKIVSPVMLLIVYVVAVVPTGLIIRAFGKDLLRLRAEPDAKSYWIHRTPPGKPDDTMTRQF